MHEAYLKLAASSGTTLRDRNHFLALASRVMRNLLADHARARLAAKRGGGCEPVRLTDEALWISDDKLGAIESLDESLRRLETIDARQCRIIEQRYFGGLSLDETADAMSISLATVKRELRAARAWLAVDLAENGCAP